MQRARPFAGPGGEQRAEKAGNWAMSGDEKALQWCVARGVAPSDLTRKASSESVNSVGGFLVPQELDAEILAIRDAVGAFRIGADVRPYRSDSAVRPRRSGGVTAYLTSEGAAITESSLSWDSVGISLKKLAVLVRSSSELFEDRAPDLAGYVAEELGYAFAAREDDCGFNGDGTSTIYGCTGLAAKLVTGQKSAITAAGGHNTFLTLDATDIASVMAGVLGTSIRRAKWYVSELGYAQTLCRLAAVNGGLAATMNPDGTVAANFLGCPVVFSSLLPNSASSLSGKSMLFFGDLANSSVIAEHQEGTVMDLSLERAFDQDQVLIRGRRRVDIVNHFTGDATNFGPVAALIGG